MRIFPLPHALELAPGPAKDLSMEARYCIPRWPGWSVHAENGVRSPHKGDANQTNTNPGHVRQRELRNPQRLDAYVLHAGKSCNRRTE
jgi:hypothetical protein